MPDPRIEKVARLLAVEAELRKKHMAMMTAILAIIDGESIGEKIDEACEDVYSDEFYIDAWDR